MSFDWEDFLNLARELAANPTPGCSPDAVRRTIIGRAYYAAFGYARKYAVNNLGFTARGRSEDHGRLRDHLRRRRRNATARSLDRLREMRNGADYDEDFPIDGRSLEVVTAEALVEADYVLASLPPPAAPSP